MKRKAHNNSRDANELEIVQALEAAGARVVRLDTPVDLLVGFRGRNHLLEVKLPVGPNGGSSHSRVTDDQARFMLLWEGEPVSVVRSPQEALVAIGAHVTPAA